PELQRHDVARAVLLRDQHDTVGEHFARGPGRRGGPASRGPGRAAGEQHEHDEERAPSSHWTRFRAYSKISKFRRSPPPRAPGASGRFRTKGTVCSLTPPCERSGSRSSERS